MNDTATIEDTPLTQAINALRAANWTDKAIGKEVGTDQSSVNRISRGLRDPAFSLGWKIVELAQRVARGEIAAPDTSAAA